MRKSWITILMSVLVLSSNYDCLASSEAEAFEGEGKSVAKPSLKEVFSGKTIDVVNIAEQNITGRGREEFLQYLNDASNKNKLAAFKKVTSGIRTGFVDSQAIAYKDPKIASKILYSLSFNFGKNLYDAGGEPRTDEALQEAIRELFVCYNLGIGVKSNEKIAELLSEYIPNDEDADGYQSS